MELTLANGAGEVMSVEWVEQSPGVYIGSDLALEANVTGIENVTGTQSFDKIQGDKESNEILGLGGDDLLGGGGGSDWLDGGFADDYLLSDPDRALDTLFGGPGIDQVWGWKTACSKPPPTVPPTLVSLQDELTVVVATVDPDAVTSTTKTPRDGPCSAEEAELSGHG